MTQVRYHGGRNGSVVEQTEGQEGNHDPRTDREETVHVDLDPHWNLTGTGTVEVESWAVGPRNFGPTSLCRLGRWTSADFKRRCQEVVRGAKGGQVV